MTESISSRFRPKRLASHPVIGRMIAFATRYDVNTQVASSMVADKLPAMWGSDTLTTVVSSTSMKVANITATAMSHGLMVRWGSLINLKKLALMKPFLSGIFFVVLTSLNHFVNTVGATDSPGRSRCSGSWPARARCSQARAGRPSRSYRWRFRAAGG